MTKYEALEFVLGKSNTYVSQLRGAKSNEMFYNYIMKCAMKNTITSLEQQIKELQGKIEILKNAK